MTVAMSNRGVLRTGNTTLAALAVSFADRVVRLRAMVTSTSTMINVVVEIADANLSTFLGG